MMAQVKSTMLVTLWVFIGIEGASVYSSYAAKRPDVGAATVIGYRGRMDTLMRMQTSFNIPEARKQAARIKVKRYAVPAMADWPLSCS
jgi:hypothetical protein